MDTLIAATVQIPMCFYTVLVKSTVGRIRVSLTKPRKSTEDLPTPNRQRDAGAAVRQRDSGNAKESGDLVRSVDAEQSDSVSVGAEQSTVHSEQTIREIEADFKWAGWSKSQSIIEASRIARAKQRTHS